MGLRIFAAVLAVLFGTAAALAQSDRAQAETRTGRRRQGQAKPKTAEKKKPAAKPKPKTDAKSDGKSETAEKPTPAAAKKTKSAEAPDKSANGSAATRAGQGEPARGLRDHAARRAHRAAVRSDLDRRLQRPDRRPVQRPAGRRRQSLPEAPEGQADRRAERRRSAPRCPPRSGRGRTRSAGGWPRTRSPARASACPARSRPRSPPAQSGTRWSSEQGQLQIETFRIDTGATLEAVFEQQKKLPRQRITYNVLRPDFFVISGMQRLEEDVRARLRQGRRGARHHHPVRPGDGRHDGPDRGGDVERVHAVRELRGRGRRHAAAQGRVRHRPGGEHVGPRRHRRGTCSTAAR